MHQLIWSIVLGITIGRYCLYAPIDRQINSKVLPWRQWSYVSSPIASVCMLVCLYVCPFPHLFTCIHPYAIPIPLKKDELSVLVKPDTNGHENKLIRRKTNFRLSLYFTTTCDLRPSLQRKKSCTDNRQENSTFCYQLLSWEIIIVIIRF